MCQLLVCLLASTRSYGGTHFILLLLLFVFSCMHTHYACHAHSHATHTHCHRYHRVSTHLCTISAYYYCLACTAGAHMLLVSSCTRRHTLCSFCMQNLCIFQNFFVFAPVRSCVARADALSKLLTAPCKHNKHMYNQLNTNNSILRALMHAHYVCITGKFSYHC
jgi:hypothetical protein